MPTQYCQVQQYPSVVSFAHLPFSAIGLATPKVITLYGKTEHGSEIELQVPVTFSNPQMIHQHRQPSTLSLPVKSSKISKMVNTASQSRTIRIFCSAQSKQPLFAWVKPTQSHRRILASSRLTNLPPQMLVLPLRLKSNFSQQSGGHRVADAAYFPPREEQGRQRESSWRLR